MKRVELYRCRACSALVFGRARIPHLVEVHARALAAVTDTVLLEHFEPMVDDDPGTETTRCPCGGERVRPGSPCARCVALDAVYYRDGLRTDSARLARLSGYRTRARAQGKCGTCRKRPAEDGCVSCAPCLAASRARQVGRERGAR